MKKFDFPTAFKSWGREEQDAISRVIASDRYTQGPEVEVFENEFAAFHGMKYGVMCNSGSSANLLTIATLIEHGSIKAGDNVIVPAIAWSTTYSPLVKAGLKLRLVDVDTTWNADHFTSDMYDDWDADEGAGLVVGCSILGNPAHLKEWQNIAGVIGAIFVEDNCESLGATTREGKLCGTFGVMNSFSLFMSHQIAAIEGGVILTDDDDFNRTLRMLRAHGWTRDIKKPESFDEEYRFELFGYNLRGLELHAAIARAQLKKLPGFIEERNKNWLRFRKWTDHLPIIHPDINGNPSPFGLHFMVESQEKRAELVKALRAESIDCRLPTGGSFTQYEYGKPWRSQLTPNANEIHRRGFFLGNAPYPIEEKIAKAVEVMSKVL